MTRELRFETDTSVSKGQALEMVRAALDDEGMTLGPRVGTHDDVTSAIIRPGVQVWRVPETRIVSVDEDKAMRARYEAEIDRQLGRKET